MAIRKGCRGLIALALLGMLPVPAPLAAADLHYKDRLLVELDAQYPEYGFARHKGYPTREHLANLRKHGPCPAHRKSFGPVRAVLELRLLPD